MATTMKVTATVSQSGLALPKVDCCKRPELVWRKIENFVLKQIACLASGLGVQQATIILKQCRCGKGHQAQHGKTFLPRNRIMRTRPNVRNGWQADVEAKSLDEINLSF